MLRALLFFFTPLVSALSCLNEMGLPTDMWAAIKAPKGTDYLYYEPDQTLARSQYSMNDTGHGALTYTTQQLWSSETDSYIIFNDSPPGATNYNYSFGHTKGYFAIASDFSGFYITHSIPQYPQGPKETSHYLGLGGNAYTYAQNVMCLSVNVSTLDALAYKFLLNRPQIYESSISPIITQNYPNISNLAQGKYSEAAICANDVLQTTGGLSFTMFAKSAEWNKDLYDACVAPTLESSLWVETWIRGSEEGPSCPMSGYETLNVEDLDFNSDFSWSETQDHSKWAIALEKDIFCMGDINRMTTQYVRGGGTACIQDITMFNALKSATMKTDSCYLR